MRRPPWPGTVGESVAAMTFLPTLQTPYGAETTPGAKPTGSTTPRSPADLLAPGEPHPPDAFLAARIARSAGAIRAFLPPLDKQVLPAKNRALSPRAQGGDRPGSRDWQ
jgi:hypothetical protein